MKFLGHVIDSQGIRADPDKTLALENIKVESTQLCLRVLGMANQLGKISPRLLKGQCAVYEAVQAEHNKRDLLDTKKSREEQNSRERWRQFARVVSCRVVAQKQ